MVEVIIPLRINIAQKKLSPSKGDDDDTTALGKR